MATKGFFDDEAAVALGMGMYCVGYARGRMHKPFPSSTEIMVDMANHVKDQDPDFAAEGCVMLPREWADYVLESYASRLSEPAMQKIVDLQDEAVKSYVAELILEWRKKDGVKPEADEDEQPMSED